jgi:hypothetical protein
LANFHFFAVFGFVFGCCSFAPDYKQNCQKNDTPQAHCQYFRAFYDASFGWRAPFWLGFYNRKSACKHNRKNHKQPLKRAKLRQPTF